MLSKNIVIGLSGSQKLAARIAKRLKINLTNIETKHFADGETIVRVLSTVRAKDVYLIQATSKPVNENLMELLIAIDSLKRASAASITVICPYYGYARQDRKTSGREPITCKLVSKLIETAGATRLAVVDLHSEQAQGFFDIPVDTITATYMLIEAIKRNYKLVDNWVIVSPDYGSVKRARKIANICQLPIAILDKRRPKPNFAEITNILGSVKNKNCLLIDDMIDTGRTLLSSCKILKKFGAKQIVVAATHGLFSHSAIKNFNLAYENKVVNALYITNSIDHVYDLQIKNLQIVDLSNFLAEVIKIYISDGQKTISQLYAKTRKLY